MNAINILDNYRLSLSNDKYALYILANLFRSGALSEKELSVKFDIGKKRLLEKLTELYRAQLVCSVKQDRWIHTDIAEELISRLGILEAVSKSLLADYAINDSEKSFLQACIEYQATERPETTRYYASILRNISLLHSDLFEDTNKLKKKHSQLLFSSIVGMDSDYLQLDGNQYYIIVLDWHRSRKTNLWKEHNGSWKIDENSINSSCVRATSDIKLSNKFLLYADNIDINHKFSQRCYNITANRLISCLTSNYMDKAIFNSSKLNKNINSVVWNILNSESPKVKDKTNDLLLILNKIDNEDISNWENIITKRLHTLIADTDYDYRPYGMNSRLPCDNSIYITGALSPMREKWIENTLQRIISQTNEGHFDNFSNRSVKRILKMLRDASESFSGRFERSNSNNAK